jgi:hypothetical protein
LRKYFYFSYYLIVKVIQNHLQALHFQALNIFLCLRSSCKKWFLLFFFLCISEKSFAQKKFEDDLSPMRLRYQYQKPALLPTMSLESKVIFPQTTRDITLALNAFLDKGMSDGKISKVQGYRLMVFSDRDREKAENAKRKALQVFGNEKITMVFERPNYRIKVGEFLNKDDADEAKKKALKYFSEVIVVPDWIKIIRLTQSPKE